MDEDFKGDLWMEKVEEESKRRKESKHCIKSNEIREEKIGCTCKKELKKASSDSKGD